MHKYHVPNIKICTQFCGTLVLIRLHKKADLLEMKVKSIKHKKARVDENKLDLGRNGCHTLGSLGSRSNVVVRQAGLQASRQADNILAV